MKRNISTLDKNIRLLIIVVIAILGLYNEFSRPVGLHLHLAWAQPAGYSRRRSR